MKRAIAIAILLVGGISGCAIASPQSVVSPMTTPTSSSTAAPAAEPLPSKIIVSAVAIEIVDEDGGALHRFDYFEPIDTIVPALSAVFGTEPVVETVEGPTTPPSTVYSWGVFAVSDSFLPVEEPWNPEYFVRVQGAEVGGLSIEGTNGIAVGSSASAVEAAYPDQSNRITAGSNPERLDVRLGTIALPLNDSLGVPAPEVAVWFIALDPAGTITEFRAPSPNYGD